MVKWLIARFQRKCPCNKEWIEVRRVGPFHVVFWCKHCGAKAVENFGSTSITAPRMFVPQINGGRNINKDIVL